MMKTEKRLYMSWIICLVLFGVCLDQSKGASDDNLIVDCSANGIRNISKTNVPTAKIVVLKSDKTYCHFDQQECRTYITDKKTLEVIINEDEKSNVIAGKNLTRYNVTCKDEFDVTVTALPFTVSPSTTKVPTAITNQEPKLTLIIKNKKDGKPLTGNVYIGQELQLVISTTSTEYKMYPQKCVAINGENENDKFDMWAYKASDQNGNGCSTHDKAVIIEKWTRQSAGDPQHEQLTISMYAFRFTKSSQVKIMCEVHLSKSGKTCEVTQGTGTSSRRRRSSREITNNTENIIQHVYTEFVVEDYNETPNKCCGLSCSMTLLGFAFIVIRRLISDA